MNYTLLSCLIVAAASAFLTAFYLTREKKEVNQGIVKNFAMIISRISALENKPQSKIETIEFVEALKQIMKDHETMKAQMSSHAKDFNTTVTRLLATFKPWVEMEKRKEISHNEQ